LSNNCINQIKEQDVGIEKKNNESTQQHNYLYKVYFKTCNTEWLPNILGRIYDTFANNNNILFNCKNEFIRKFKNTSDYVIFYCYCNLIYNYYKKHVLSISIESINVDFQTCAENFINYYNNKYNPMQQDVNNHAYFLYVKKHTEDNSKPSIFNDSPLINAGKSMRRKTVKCKKSKRKTKRRTN
jgi:hypothetical protein